MLAAVSPRNFHSVVKKITYQQLITQKYIGFVSSGNKKYHRPSCRTLYLFLDKKMQTKNILPSCCYALFLCQISRVKMYPMIIIYLVREKEWGKPIMRNRCSIIAFRRKGVKWCVLQKWDVGLQYGVIGPHWSRTTSFALPLDIDTVAYMQINTIKQQRKHTSQQYWQQTKHFYYQKSFPLEIVLF